MTGPVLQTGRIRLEPLSQAHAEDFAGILTDRATMSFYPVPFDRAAVDAWIARSDGFWATHDYGRFAVIRREDDRLIGDAGMMRLTIDGREVDDIGWIIHRDYWGQGYATETAAAVRDDVFRRLQLLAIHANMPVEHTASRKVAERLRMREVARFANAHNGGKETHLFRQTIGDWQRGL
jgi:RimJ/RimL family protein N-acetyltransferase